MLDIMSAIPARTRDLIRLSKEEYVNKYLSQYIGKSASLSEAARQLKTSPAQIGNNVSKGHIKKTGNDKNRVLVDLSDVAYMADAMTRLELEKGQKVFNPDHTLYIPKVRLA